MESGDTTLAVVGTIHVNAFRDLDRLGRVYKELEESLALTLKPMTDSFAALAPFFEQQAEMQRRVTEALAPTVRMADEIAKTMQPFLDSVARMQEAVQGVSLPRFSIPSIVPSDYDFKSEPVRYVPESGPRVVRLDEYTMNAIVGKVVVLLKADVQKTLPTETTALAPLVPMLAGAKWEDVKMYFQDNHAVKIFHQGKSLGVYDYAQLGFARGNTRDKSPSKAWMLLQKLSLLLELGGMKPTKQNLVDALHVTGGACEKQKATLSKKLQVACGISDDPFRGYDAEAGYQPKFTLKPEPILRGDGELHRSGGKLPDWKLSGDESDEY